MSKELLIYGDINSYSAQDFITAMQELGEDPVTIRINTDGGEPQYGWGMIAKLSEYSGKKLIKADGKARSMGAFFLLYGDDVECLDVSEFVFHRAAYSQWYEENYMTEAEKAILDTVNKNLRAAFENKIDVELFEKITKVTVDQLFSNDARIDVILKPKDAKKIGLVNRIIPITPIKEKEISARMEQITAKYISKNKIAAKQTTTMTTLDELKAQYPDLYKKAVSVGVKKERTRVSAWTAFQKIDAEAVAKGIAEGKKVDAAVMAEMTAKSISATALAKITAENAPQVEASKEPGKEEQIKTDKEEKIEAFLQEAKGYYTTKPTTVTK